MLPPIVVILIKYFTRRLFATGIYREI